MSIENTMMEIMRLSSS